MIKCLCFWQKLTRTVNETDMKGIIQKLLVWVAKRMLLVGFCVWFYTLISKTPLKKDNWINAMDHYSRRSGRITVIWERNYSSVRIMVGLKDCVYTHSEQTKYTTFSEVFEQSIHKSLWNKFTAVPVHAKLKLQVPALQERK